MRDVFLKKQKIIKDLLEIYIDLMTERQLYKHIVDFMLLIAHVKKYYCELNMTEKFLSKLYLYVLCPIIFIYYWSR